MKFNFLAKRILIGILLFATACDGTVVPEPGEPNLPTEPTESVEPSPPVELPAPSISLRINVVEYTSLAMYSQGDGTTTLDPADESGLITEAMNRIAAEMGLAEPQIEVTYLAANPDGCSAVRPLNVDAFDIVMIDGVCAAHAFQEYEIADVLEGFADNYTDQIFKPAQTAFRDPAGNLKAVAVGTSPMLLIYNPDLVDILPDPLSYYDIPVYFDRDRPLVIPPHAAIPMAIAESYLDPFVETDLLALAFYDQLLDLSGSIDDMTGNGQIASAATDEILGRFIRGEIGGTLQSLMFLRMLKLSGYEGPLHIARMPQASHTGGSAMSVAWAVSQKSLNQEVAWEFLSRLLYDPQVVEWLLANGFLPTNPAGFVLVQENPELYEPWMDSRLVTDDQNWEVLRASSESSTIWQLPATVPADIYNDRVIPTSMDLLNRVFNGLTPAPEGFEEWKAFLQEVGLGQ
jgi:ABC-type glycerol-3-phosphate transport system substrate-binding protein